MADSEALKRRREHLLEEGNLLMLRYSLMETFTSVSELEEYLKDHSDTNTLHLANAKPEFVRCYLNFILQQEDNYHDLTSITFYAFQHDEVSLLQAFPADFDFHTPLFTESISILVAGNGFMDILMFFLHRGLFDHSDVRDKCLYNAAVHKQIDAVRFFLDIGADPNMRPVEETTFMIEAVTYSTADIMKLLVSQGGDVYEPLQNLWQHAAMRGDEEIMNFLHGMNVPMEHDIIRAYLAEATSPFRFNEERIDGHALQTLQRVVGLLRHYGAQEPTSLHDVHLLPRHLEALKLQ